MPSLLAALSGVMKQFYAKTPVQALMNDEANAYNLMSKGAWTWDGDNCRVPWHVAHDAVNAAWIAENGGLGTTGAGPVTAMLNVPARTINKLMQVSGLSLDQVKTNSFLPSLQLNMQDTVAQVLNGIDQAVFGGGPTKCFLNQHKLEAAGAGRVYDASGDLADLQAAVTAFGGNLIVDIVRDDTLAVICTGATIVLAADVNVGAGTVTMTLPVGGCDSTLAGPNAIPDTTALSIRITSVGLALPFTTQQPNGIYGGFSEPTYHNVLRTAAGMGNSIGPVITTATTGLHERVAMTADTLAGVIVAHNRRCSDNAKKMDLVMVEPGALQEYASLVTQTVNFQKDISKGATSFDVGVKLDEGKMFGIPVKSYQRCGRGLAVFVNLASWKMAELKRPGWSKYGGDILRQAANPAAFGNLDGAEGNYYWRGNFVNQAPNASVCLVGFDFAGAA